MKFLLTISILINCIYCTQSFQNTNYNKIRFPKFYTQNNNIEHQKLLDNINPKYISLSINKDSLEIAERKHSQVAIMGVLTLLSSEFFLGDYLFEGKGINLIESFIDNSSIYLTIIFSLQSIHELIFRGGFPLHVNKSLLDKEIFFGRLSMMFIMFFFIYEIYYDVPLINNDFKIIINLIFLYFKILLSVQN